MDPEKPFFSDKTLTLIQENLSNETMHEYLIPFSGQNSLNKSGVHFFQFSFSNLIVGL